MQSLLGEAVFDADEMDAWVAPPAPEAPARRLSVLLCDDNEINLLLGRGLLERLGHVVTTAADGRRALAAVEETRTDGAASYDLILMDLHMPEMDGIEAARRIRLSLDGARAPRIVALTADLMSETRQRCEAGLFDAWIGKPLLPDALDRAIADLVFDTTAATARSSGDSGRA